MERAVTVFHVFYKDSAREGYVQADGFLGFLTSVGDRSGARRWTSVEGAQDWINRYGTRPRPNYTVCDHTGKAVL